MNEQNKTTLPNTRCNKIQEICKNPENFSKYVKQIATRIDESRKKLEVIKGRSWWEKMISSTSDDLSQEMIEHTALISDLFNVLQVVSYMCKGNSALLLGFMNSLNKTTDAEGKESEFLNMTKQYLQQLLDDSKTSLIRDKAIKKLLVNCIQLNKNHEQLRKEQEEFIETVNSIISEQFKFIKESNSSFQEAIDKLQFENDKKTKELEGYQTRLCELEKSFFWKTKFYHLLVGILSVISILLSLLLLIR